jgi:oxygen-independent coproporphyrinogen-3 oxidase
MLALPTIAPPAPIPEHEDDAAVLGELLRKPQRHRLLHGYPLAAAMRRRDASQAEADLHFDFQSGRGLLVGVLPHPFCNPAVAGCGFCTFPHRKYDSAQAAEFVTAVLAEVEQRVRRQPDLLGRPVTGLYFGGGTANLSPAEPFRALCRGLARCFDLRHAEVTLEGVPAYFVKRRPLLMEVLREEIPARHFRLSMGIQTFDEEWLGRMGRLGFGTAATFRAVVEEAHAREFTVSADLLFNLPNQTRAAMEQDVDRAVELGLDHLGLYHLVLFRGLGTAWSKDESLVAALPSNKAAAENWLALQWRLLRAGFYQTTLTNFERSAFRGDPRRFLYEECSFVPDRYEMLGFGPSAISFAAGRNFGVGSKVLNPDAPHDYLAAVARDAPVWDRYFSYTTADLQVFYLTRRLAALEVNRAEYRRLFGTDPLADFGEECRALADAELLQVTSQALRPTPRGMFYADAMASLWAWRRVRALRDGSPQDVPGRLRPDRRHDNSYGHM